MNSTSALASKPWEQPFWKPARGKWAVFTYIILIHLIAITGLVLFPTPSWKIVAISFFLACLGGLGATIGYHRALAHRTLKLNKAIEHALVFCAMFNGTGAPASWVAYHRLHHSRADTPGDISSPKLGGFWWAHIRWLYQSARAETEKWCPEFTRGSYRAWTLVEVPLILVSLTVGLLYSWEAFFWIGAIRLAYSLHIQCLVNSLTHLGEAEDGDSSQNIWWLGPLQLTCWGENWHGNHHAAPGSARFGWHWWQVDIGWYCIWTLESLGLASQVKRPRAELLSN